MKKISLTQNKFTKVDDIAYDYLNQWSWQYNNGYAKRTQRIPETKNKFTVYMHRAIMQVLDVKGDAEVDHINGDRLDNQMKNLRLTTRQKNRWNAKSNGGSSRYKGVWYRNDPKRKFKWVAEIIVDGKKIHLGSHKTEELAARAVDEAIKKHHGKYARLNFPE